MKVSEKGLNLIKSFEGCSLKSYKNQGEEYYTIGYGHYGSDVGVNQEISQQQAEDMLVNDINNEYAEYVNKLINEGYLGFTVNQNQFDALTSFVYNLGFSNLKLLCQNKRNIQQVADKMLEYTNSGSEIYRQGLLKRRQAERELFLDGNVPVVTHNKTQDANYISIAANYLSTSFKVKLVQLLLNCFGWSLNPDGICGDKTATAIGEFQDKYGLDKDYKFGPQCINKAYDLIKDRICGLDYKTPNETRVIQHLLKLNVDGVFWTLTNNAVRTYQGMNCLKVDGVVGQNTWRKLLGL